MPEQIPTTVVGIVGSIVVMVLTLATIMVRGAVKTMSEQAKAERDVRLQQAKDASESMRSVQAAMLQIAGFMATLTEQMRTVQTELIRAALREPLGKHTPVIVENATDKPVPVIPVRKEENK